MIGNYSERMFICWKHVFHSSKIGQFIKNECAKLNKTKNYEALVKRCLESMIELTDVSFLNSLFKTLKANGVQNEQNGMSMNYNALRKLCDLSEAHFSQITYLGVQLNIKKKTADEFTLVRDDFQIEEEDEDEGEENTNLMFKEIFSSNSRVGL